uniref:Uncharacterized protein n=1 Tax=Glossina pallidipes TaxID=7398 RepID=A0A1A9ZP48_GLOPL
MSSCKRTSKNSFAMECSIPDGLLDGVIKVIITANVYCNVFKIKKNLSVIDTHRSDIRKFLEAIRCCIARSMALDEQCNQFFNGTNKLNRVCAAYYPSFGTSSATGDEYVVYQLDGKQSRYFITLGMSAITSCKGTIYMESDSEYQCDGVTLQLPPGKLPKLYCLTFPFIFSKILVAHCTRDDSINPQQTAILYPNTRKFQSFEYWEKRGGDEEVKEEDDIDCIPIIHVNEPLESHE